MKKLILFAAVSLGLLSCSKDGGEVRIQLPKDFKEKTLVVSHVTIDNAFKATKQEDLKIIYDTLQVNNGIAEMKLDASGAAQYNIESPVISMSQAEFYASPGDNLKINIKSFNPLDYTVTGTELMEDIMNYISITRPIQMEYYYLVNASDSVSEEQATAYQNRYDAAVKKFVADHPKSQAIPYVIIDLSGDDFKKAYDSMTPEAKKSILMPYAELFNREVEKMQKDRAEEAAQKAKVASGTIEAPNFTLLDLNGKKVSLSDFKGKWVVLDFWGSWCGWCIKGFPALKEAYEKYGDKIVVIGIDCNESEADWKEGVKKYQIPWLNLYNGNDQSLYEDYNITGFPTKAIINPQGKLVDLTTGDDPEFYERLASFVGK